MTLEGNASRGYSGQKVLSFSIVGNMSLCTVEGAPTSLTCTGGALDPAANLVVKTPAGKALTRGSGPGAANADYYVKYFKYTNIGTSNYNGSPYAGDFSSPGLYGMQLVSTADPQDMGDIQYFYVVTAGKDLATAQVTGFQDSYTYTGKNLMSTQPVVKVGGTELKAGRDYTYTIEAREPSTRLRSYLLGIDPQFLGVEGLAAIPDDSIVHSGSYVVSICPAKGGDYFGSWSKSFTVEEPKVSGASGVVASSEAFVDRAADNIQMGVNAQEAEVTDDSYKHVFDVTLTTSAGTQLRDGFDLALEFPVPAAYEGCVVDVTQKHTTASGQDYTFSYPAQRVKDNKVVVPTNCLSEFTLEIAAAPQATNYTVTFNSNGGSAVSPVTVGSGQTVAQPSCTRAGYTLSGWYLGTQKVRFPYTVTSDVTLTARWTAVSMKVFRLYNPNSGEHLYTENAAERTYLASIGWRDEGVGWNAPTVGDDVYRLYNPNSGDHHYTMSKSERDFLAKIGWIAEGPAFKSGAASGVKIYRQFNPNETVGTHNFTTSAGENSYLASIGWKPEGIAFYGI